MFRASRSLPFFIQYPDDENAVNYIKEVGLEVIYQENYDVESHNCT